MVPSERGLPSAGITHSSCEWRGIGRHVAGDREHELPRVADPSWRRPSSASVVAEHRDHRRRGRADLGRLTAAAARSRLLQQDQRQRCGERGHAGGRAPPQADPAPQHDRRSRAARLPRRAFDPAPTGRPAARPVRPRRAGARRPRQRATSSRESGIGRGQRRRLAQLVAGRAGRAQIRRPAPAAGPVAFSVIARGTRAGAASRA